MKSLPGQYECIRRSGLGLDYFTSRLDRLILYTRGRFTLIEQEKSRLLHAAKSLASGQQSTMEAPEKRNEGSYTTQGDVIIFTFDDGSEVRGNIQENGLQIGPDFYEKVSESTLIPSQNRIQNNMEDIAKGLKIAGAIGGTLMKAAKTVQDTLHSQRASDPQNQQSSSNQPAQSYNAPNNQPPVQSYTPPPPASQTYVPNDDTTLFCDQCGAPTRPGKKFCSKCGAQLP